MAAAGLATDAGSPGPPSGAHRGGARRVAGWAPPLIPGIVLLLAAALLKSFTLVRRWYVGEGMLSLYSRRR